MSNTELFIRELDFPKKTSDPTSKYLAADCAEEHCSQHIDDTVRQIFTVLGKPADWEIAENDPLRGMDYLARLTVLNLENGAMDLFLNGFLEEGFLDQKSTVKTLILLIRKHFPECQTLSFIGADHQRYKCLRSLGEIICSWENPNTGAWLEYITVRLEALNDGK